MQFFGYKVPLQGISIENQKIEAVSDGLKSYSIWDIQILLGFANFFWQFIHSFNWIDASLTYMLRTIKSIIANKLIFVININEVDDGKMIVITEGDKKSKKEFLIFRAKLAFDKLRQAFSMVLILHDFDLGYYILIETDVLGYAIGKIFSLLFLDHLI